MHTTNEQEPIRTAARQGGAGTGGTKSAAGHSTTAIPAAIPAIFGGIAGLTGISLLVVPLVVIGIMRHISAPDAGVPGVATAAAGGGSRTPLAPAAPAPGPSATELGALRLLPAGNPEEGEEHYAAYCTACHGVDGKGRPNLGKDLVSSPFVKDQSDAQLIAFIKRGRDVNDPLNTTKMPMPPKAGNPAFTDKELNDVVAFMRQLQKKG
jgi:mono/diheme cytochrome c family protein